MRRSLLFLISMVWLNGVTEIHQFLKMPRLVNHLQHHRATDPSLSLLDFLRLHYNRDPHPDDQDETEDRELPFRSGGTIQHTDILFITVKRTLPVPNEFPLERTGAWHPEGEPCHRSFPVFHPPRRG